MTLKEIILLGLILFFTLSTRLFRLDYPSQMYFDEVYHVPAAMMMSVGDFSRPFDAQQASYDGQNVADWLHPPLAKYFQAGAMSLFGKNPMAWRLPSVFFATLAILVFYFLVKHLGLQFFFKHLSVGEQVNKSVNLSLVASYFLSLSGLFLVQSRIAMNDVFLLFFLILAIFVYFVYLDQKRYLFLFLTGLFLALALSVKWTAFWFILLLLIREVASIKSYRELPFLLFCFLLTPVFSYVLSYLPMFMAGNHLSDFLILQKTILLSHLSNPSFHLYSSDPLSWLINWRPVWFFTSNSWLSAGFVANIYALENPLLNFYLLLTFVLVFLSLLKRDRLSLARKTIWLLFSFYLASFLPWIFFSRPMFLYHYLPALPFLIILLAYFLLNFLEKITDLSKRRALFFNLLFWPFFFFLIFYPQWTAWPVPESFADIIYFAITSWR